MGIIDRWRHLVQGSIVKKDLPKCQKCLARNGKGEEEFLNLDATRIRFGEKIPFVIRKYKFLLKKESMQRKVQLDD